MSFAFSTMLAADGSGPIVVVIILIAIAIAVLLRAASPYFR